MKISRFLATILAFLCLTVLMTGHLFSVSAAQIYLPDTEEVGDRDTNTPAFTYYDKDGNLNTDRIPKPVDWLSDILLPSGVFAASAAVVYIALRIIRFFVRRKEERSARK